jgi:flagellar biosynthesis/type III secretory pathway M-ring protein FliF/YscJ
MFNFNNLEQKEKIEIIIVLIIIILGIVGYVFFKDRLILKQIAPQSEKESIIESLTAPEKELTAEEKARIEEIKKDLTAPANSKSKVSEDILKSLTVPE